MEGNPPLAGPDGWHARARPGPERRPPGHRPGAAGLAGTCGTGRPVGSDAGGARGTHRPGRRRNPPPALGRHRGVRLCRRPGAGALRGCGRWQGAGRLGAFGAAALGKESAPLAALGRRRAVGCGGHCAGHGLDMRLCLGAAAAPHGRLAASGCAGAGLTGTAHPRAPRPWDWWRWMPGPSRM